MARPERFELPTYSSGGCRSIQLSYGRAAFSLHPDFSLIKCWTGNSPGSGAIHLRVAQVYQRPRPPPPPLRSRPPRPPPPPPPALRSGFGRASFTFKVRPPTCEPFSAAIAFSPSSALAISTNPKPRERPVSRSVMIATRSTCPYASNNWRSSSSDVLKSRFPTKMFFKRVPQDGLFER